MKTAYELALERLSKTAPMAKLTQQQKQDIADLEAKYKAKTAEREIAIKDQMTQAAHVGDYEKMQKLEQELLNERKKLQAEAEEKKEEVRQRK